MSWGGSGDASPVQIALWGSTARGAPSHQPETRRPGQPRTLAHRHERALPPLLKTSKSLVCGPVRARAVDRADAAGP